VIDSHLFRSIALYNDDAEALFSIAEGRQIAWAVRRENPELRAALDSFVIEKVMTAHRQERSTGDLDAIRKRGSLRVLTRNNPATYFLHQGRKFGFDYELAELAAKELKVRLELVVVPSRDKLVPWLLEGRGDAIAASFTATPERAAQVAFTRPYLLVEELLVQRSAGPKLASPAELVNRTVHVRPSSSYHETLSALQPRFGPFTIAPLPEDEETERALGRVADGELDFTVADSHLLQIEQAWRDGLEAAFPLPVPREGVVTAEAGDETRREIAFAVRPGNPQLLGWLDDFVRRRYRGVEYNLARRRYFENRRVINNAREGVAAGGSVSSYDELFRRYSRQYGFDWRLIAAQAYQESRFDPKARSWVGARGLMQVMPATGLELGFKNLEDPEQGVHAGVRYMHRMVQRLDPKIPFKHRVRFALAAYNCGLGHVYDAQRLAGELGLDGGKWFQNAEKAMLLLAEPRHYAKARHGYVRGAEPVKYVSEILNRYDNYVQLVPE
jgi:membrane-bound lytic murein transglycosylase F